MAAFARADEAAPTARRLDFTREIRPILANHCWSCHGPDEQHRKAGLRLDLAEGSRARLESGFAAIVPGKSRESELVTRIETADDSEIMPPPVAKKPLTLEQKKLLRLWIDQGAEYAQHWAFSPPKRHALPWVKHAGWARNSIDLFVLKRLEDAGLSPAREADKATLLRRVTLDLTGLPPTLGELDDFLADNSANAYERVVDRLLASPRYGEKMAMQWLDAARYADTNGYNNDEERTMWPWRDWVIRAFNSNMPFDRFLVEQLAGDLLPNPMLEQKIATGFNRNHVLTTEGGIIDEEYRVEYVADRVHTTATVVMGLSMQCARCHDHKYDPITQREYYQFFAFFNNVADKTVKYNQGAVAEPYLKAPTAEQQQVMARLTGQKALLEKQLADRKANVDEPLAKWESRLSSEQKQQLARAGQTLRVAFDETEGDQVAVQDGQGAGNADDAAMASPRPHPAPLPEGEEICGDAPMAVRGKITGPATWKPGKLGNALAFEGETFVDLSQRGIFDRTDEASFGAWVFPTSNEAIAILSKVDDAQAFRGYDFLLEGGKPAVHLIHHWPDNGLKVIAQQPITLNAWHHLLVTWDGSGKAAGLTIYVDGRLQQLEITNDKLAGTIKTDEPLRIGRRSTSNPFRGLIDDVRFFNSRLSADDAQRLADGGDVAGLGEILALPPEKRSAEQREQLRRFYLETVDAEFRRAKIELAEAARRYQEVDSAAPKTMVMAELAQPRAAHILIRGQYDQPGEAVEVGVPAVFSSLPADAPLNRLGLARWLVQPSHPLTARVAVNRWWGMYFGMGLVETAEDFGVQGSLPSHPELLDRLATEFIGAWNIKALQRLIVTSATYRQSSQASPALIERDPKNRLLARGPRFRIPAESVRDNALAISGLLRDRIGGPSVKPYQPAGLWEEVSVERRYKYVPDKNDGLYRRSMYTFWKRTCPPPGMMAFDAPDRETCLIRRATTNTPVQALVLLNDPTYIESARKLAERLLKEAGPAPIERLTHAFRLAISRPPNGGEQRILLRLYYDSLARFHGDGAAAEKLLSVGDSPRDLQLDAAELAAWTTLASIVLNLDETITKN
ncbi:MAG: DUF1553 domain-containing protein [Deltaproteobacteria bacterium]